MESKPWDNWRFEFVLYIKNGRRKEDGNNIICERKFDMKGYNPKVLKSLELRELLDKLAGTEFGPIGNDMGIIPKHFKKLSKDLSWNTYNPYRINTDENVNIFENEDVFTLEIKVDGKAIGIISFSGNWFQTDVRYTVNIRKIIPEIIYMIQETFSRRSYTTQYNDQDLMFEFAPYKFNTL